MDLSEQRGDAVTRATEKVHVGGRLVNARGVSTDVVEASARAFLHAINEVVSGTVAPERERTDTP